MCAQLPNHSCGRPCATGRCASTPSAAEARTTLTRRWSGSPSTRRREQAAWRPCTWRGDPDTCPSRGREQGGGVVGARRRCMARGVWLGCPDRGPYRRTAGLVAATSVRTRWRASTWLWVSWAAAGGGAPPTRLGVVARCRVLQCGMHPDVRVRTRKARPGTEGRNWLPVSLDGRATWYSFATCGEQASKGARRRGVVVTGWRFIFVLVPFR